MRKIDHLLYALKLGSDIITAPFGVLKEWAERDLLIPGNDYMYNSGDLRHIPFRDIELVRNWQEYDIYHELTDKGMEKFSEDWNSLVK
ncbi:MAG: hypothetical protein ACK415_09485 [Thermodesulfovibrionales bacterium]